MAVKFHLIVVTIKKATKNIKITIPQTTSVSITHIFCGLIPFSCSGTFRLISSVSPYLRSPREDSQRIRHTMLL